LHYLHHRKRETKQFLMILHPVPQPPIRI
jgi:hypothetical protein